MEQLTTNEALAGEMLNPATENISTAEPVQKRAIPEITVSDVSRRGQGDAVAPVSEPAMPSLENVYSEPTPETPIASDVQAVSFDAETGDASVYFSSDVGNVLRRRWDSRYVQEWLRNPGDEESALSAGFILYQQLNPEATCADYIDAMRSCVFGAGTDNPRNCANRLFEIVGGNADALDLASQIERGEISPQDALRSLSADAQAKFADVDEWQARNKLKVADAFRQTVFDSNVAKEWRALSADGFSAKEILSVFKLTEILGRGDKSTAEDWFPRVMQDAEIPAHRRGSVLEAVKARLPKEDAGFWSRLWTRTGEMAETVSSSLVNASEAKGAAEILKYGASVFDANRAFTERELAMLNAVLGTESEYFGDEVRKKLSAQGIKYEAGKFHQLADAEKLAVTRAYREVAYESADVAQARAVVLTNYAKKFADGNAVADWTADNLLGIAENLAWLGASIFTYGAVTPVMFARYGLDSYGNTFNEALAEGADVDRAATAGQISAVGTTALEAIPAGRLLGIAGRGLKNFTGGLLGEGVERFAKSLSEVTNSDLADLFLPPSRWKKVARGAKSFMGTLGAEFSTEVAQASVEGGAAQWAIDGDWLGGAMGAAYDSTHGKSGFDLAASIFAISLGGEAMARGVKWRDHRKAVEDAVRRSGTTPESRAEAEQVFIAEAKKAHARKATIEVMAAIDAASDGRAFGGDGKMTADMQAFVHRAMTPDVDKDGSTTGAYSRAWTTKKKDAFLREINGGKAVPTKMRKALDLLDAASEVAGEQVKEAVDKFKAATDKQLKEGVEQLQGEEAGQDTPAAATLPGNGGVDVNPATLSREHLGELVGRFLSDSPKMGDADISKELRAVFLGEEVEGADENVVAALNGVAKRCTSAFEFLSFLDAYAESCDAELKTRTTERTRADRVNYYGFQHVGTLARPDTNYERFTRLAYLAGTRDRRSLGVLTDEQRVKMQTMLGKIFAGTQVQFGGVPAWASAEAQAAIERGEVNGLYSSGKVWISDNAFVGTGLHEAVWHATWAWAKQSAPELYKQMQSYVRNAPRWLREQIAQDYAGKSGVSFDEIADEIGAFLFENEFEGDFLNTLNTESRSWWDGLRKVFGKAFKKLRGNAEGTTNPHAAVRELMQDFLNGETVAASGSGASQAERYSAAAAAAMNRTGDIPGGKSPREVAERIEANNKVSVTGTLSEEVRKAADAWGKDGSSKSRHILARVILNSIPVDQRKIDLGDDDVLEITATGVGDILQHMPNAQTVFRDGAIEFIQKIPAFMKNAEEFYRETKRVLHRSFGGVVAFAGTPLYVSITCVDTDMGLRVKAVNSIKKASLNAWTETTASGESGSVLKAAFKLEEEKLRGKIASISDKRHHLTYYSPKLNTSDALTWILSNQDKTAADFRLFLRGWDDAEESRRKGDERWSKARNLSLGDAEAQRIEAEAKANGTWLKAPNGKPSKLNARQWVQVRTEAFKKWFGDWENVAKKKQLDSLVIAEVEKGAFKPVAGKTPIESAVAWAEAHKEEVETVIGKVLFDGKSTKQSFSHTRYQNKYDVLPTVPKILRDGVYLGAMPDKDGATILNHYFCGRVKIGDAEHIVFVRARDAQGGSGRFYVHEVFTEEEIKKSDGKFEQGEAMQTPPAKTNPSDLYRSIIYPVLSVNEKDVSKVVDENGEPLVVYHGTDADFWMFDKHKAQDKRGRALGVGWGKGKFYFTISEAIAGTNGKRIIPAFLDVRNPVSAEEYARGIDAGENRDRSIAKQDKALVIAGTDGISDVELSGGVAVFSPSQIKSATDNVGTFDSENPDIRYSRSYRAADTHEQELARMACAVALASKMIQSGKEYVRLPAWANSLPEWERIGATNRAFNLFRVAKARGLIKDSMSTDAANTAAIEANRAITERFVHAVAADAMANGVSVERTARGRIQDEAERMARSRVDIPASVSDATKALGVALQRAQGAKISMGKSETTLLKRAMAFSRVILQAAQSRFMPRDSSPETVIDAIILEAEDAALPTGKLRELRQQVSTKEFKGADDAANVLRANAADLLTEVEAAISVPNEMLVAGMNTVKDRSVGSRIEEESTGAQRAEEAALSAFEGEDPSMIARRVATSVLVSAWRTTARALGLRGVDYNADVEDGATNPAAVLKFIVLSAEQRADDLDAQADAITEKLHSKTLTAEESREANEERNELREEALRFRDVVAPAGTFTEVFKEGAEAFVKDMLKQGGGFSVASALSALRGAVTLRDALGKAYKLFMTASTREAAANIPYLSGRLRGLLFSLPKLDERTEDDASYYSPRFRVFASQLREIGRDWWEKSFEEVQAEIDRLEALEDRDDHANAKLRALQMVGGAKNMSAEMLDTAFWTILAERDTAFLEQVSKLRKRRASMETQAKHFVDALKANPHAKPADKSATQSAKENTTSQNGLSLGDRLRGWIKNAKGELWEKASAFVDDFERRFADAASAHDRLVIAQHDWQLRTMREIFGKSWQAKLAELSTVVVPELAKFDHTSRDGVKTDDGLTAMHALHLYMSARQKSFQAPLLHPAMFSEESEGSLLSRRAYVRQAKNGGELEKFLKTHKGGVLWKLKNAWSARWKEIRPQLNEAYRNVYGFDMYDPFDETDYYPLRLKSEAKAHAAGTTAKSGAIMLPVGRRFQSRTINVAELDANRKFTEVVFEQMENTLHTIAYAEVHCDAERFMGNAAISDVRNARVAYSDVNGFKDHLADVLALPSQQGEASRFGRFAAGTSTVLALAGNIFTPIRQITGGGTYAAESPFGAGATTAAMTYAAWGTLWGGQYMTDLLRVVRDPLFRARYEEAARFVEQEALRGGAGTGASGATKRLFKKLKNASLYGVRFGDAVPIMTCGVGFYRMFYAQNLQKGMTDAQAHEKAMNDMMALTEKTQQTRRVMNKTRLQRDTGLTGQILGQFKSMNDQAFGNETRVLADLAADLKSTKRWKKAMKSVVAYHLLFGAFSDFVMQSVFIALSGDDDDESTFGEKLNLWELGAATVGGGLYGSTIAFVAFDLMNIEDVGRRIANWAFDTEVPGRRPAAVAASLPSVSILLNAGTHTAKAVSMLGDEEVEAKDAFVEFCKSFGGAKSIMRLTDKIMEDSEED